MAAAERKERRRRLAIQQYFRGGDEERDVAETLRLDLCHGCALEAAGISDDGSTVAENYLQRRRVAFNTLYPCIQDYHLMPWHPGLNELGLTTCSIKVWTLPSALHQPAAEAGMWSLRIKSGVWIRPPLIVVGDQ